MTVGDRIRAFAKARFKTQARLAEAVGMSEQAMSNLIKSAGVPTGDTLVRFAAVGANLHWILTGLGEMDAPTVGDAGTVTGAVNDPPTVYTQEQVQNVRFVDDEGMLDEPIHAGPEGVEAIRRLRRLQDLRRRERDLLTTEAEIREEQDREFEALIVALAGSLPP